MASCPREQTTESLSPPSFSSVKNFVFVSLLGEGSFSTVYLTEQLSSREKYAIKISEKRHLLRHNKAMCARVEKHVLLRLAAKAKESDLSTVRSCGGANFVELVATFQDSERLFFVMTYAPNGDLSNQLARAKTFSREAVTFYTAEIAHALHYLHGLQIIHRDLKPENVLLDANWHCLLCDFGSAAFLSPDDAASFPSVSFVGSAAFVSPEVLQGQAQTLSLDFWALGILIFKLAFGCLPFTSSSEFSTFQQILKLQYSFPEKEESSRKGCAQLKDLISALLRLDPKQRIASTYETFYEFTSHSFFKDVAWQALSTTTPPPFSKNEPNSEVGLSKAVPPKSGTSLPPGFSEEHINALHALSLTNHNSDEVEGSTTEPAALGNGLKQEERSHLKKPCFARFTNGQKVLKQSYVMMRAKLFSQTRLLILTDNNTLLYIDPKAMKLKAEIELTADVQTRLKSFKAFDLVTAQRTYTFEDREGKAGEWCQMISASNKK